MHKTLPRSLALDSSEFSNEIFKNHFECGIIFVKYATKAERMLRAACTGEIEAIVIPGPGKICGFFGTDCEYVIPFSCIKKIGPDIVLVEIKEEKFLQKF